VIADLQVVEPAEHLQRIRRLDDNEAIDDLQNLYRFGDRIITWSVAKGQRDMTILSNSVTHRMREALMPSVSIFRTKLYCSLLMAERVLSAEMFKLKLCLSPPLRRPTG
jgi:hypothetical protein